MKYRNRTLTRTALAVVTAAAMATSVAAAQPISQETALATTPDDLAELQLSGEPQELTLVTGHTIQVTTNPDGTVTWDRVGEHPVGDNADELTVNSVTEPGERPQLTAWLPSAMNMVEAGLIDPQLFDINHLLDNGYAGSAVPVTVHYTSTNMTAQDAATSADELPGSHYIEDTATEGSATVAVDQDAGHAFWEAVTRPQTYDPDTPEGWAWGGQPSTPRQLEPGITALTLDGATQNARPNSLGNMPIQFDSHGTTSDIAPAVDVPIYTVEMRFPADPDWPVFLAGTDVGRQKPSGTRVTAITGPLAEVGATGRVYCEGEWCDTVVVEMQVPEGRYYITHKNYLWKEASSAYATLWEPEVVVDRNMTLEYLPEDFLDRDGIETPMPSERAGSATNELLVVPDGTRITGGGSAALDGDLRSLGYFIPPQTTPDVSRFNLSMSMKRQQPRVHLDVVAPRGAAIDFHAQYSWAGNSVNWAFAPRFTTADDETVELVDVGDGTEEEVAGTDVAGKLALLRLGRQPGPGDQERLCSVHDTTIDRLHEAGARAIVVDTSRQQAHDEYDHHLGMGYPQPTCWAPVQVWHSNDERIKLPLINVRPDEGDALRVLLEQGQVELEVNSPPADPLGYYRPNQRLEYMYDLQWNFPGGIPDTIDWTISEEDLAVRDTKLGPSSVGWLHSFVALPPPGQDPAAGTGSAFPLPGSHTLTNFIGPVTSDMRILRRWEDRDTGSFNSAVEVIPEANQALERAGATPLTYGPMEATSTSPREGIWSVCSFCRTGDWVYPSTTLVHGSMPNYHHGSRMLPNAELSDASGNHIPLTLVGGAVPAYELPPEPQTYTLRSTTPTASYTWNFESGPTENAPPQGATCWQSLLLGEHCGEAVPMIYVRYNPEDTGVDNTAEARSRHTVWADAYHHGPSAPEVTDVTTQVSFDGGDTWLPTRARTLRDGTRTVTFKVPELSATDGHVALRTTATDAAGNTTDQTILEAYQLRPSKKGPKPQ